jgi:YVTN family beta-propeller protein
MRLTPTSQPGLSGALSAICYISLHLFATVPAVAQTVIATVNMNLDLSPYNFAGIAINPVTNKVYVAGNNNGELGVIDGATNLVTYINTSQTFSSGQIAVNTVTNKIYVAGQSMVNVIDGVTGAIVTVTDPNAQYPWGIAVNEQTNKIYVVNLESQNVTVIDGATNSTITITDPNAKMPVGVAVNAVTNKIYVANQESNNVTAIDGATNAIATITDPGAELPGSVGVNSVTNTIYVANSNSVSVIDGATNAVANVPAAGSPVALAVNPVTNKIYVSASGLLAPLVLAIDGATNATETSLAGGGGEIAVDTLTNKIYVANSGSTGVIDGATNSIIDITDPNANGPISVAVDEATDRIYVVNRLSQNVTVINGAGVALPVCQLTQVIPGPPKQLTITMQDTGSGLQTIQLFESINSTVNIPEFAPGTTSAVLVTATKLDQAESSDVGFLVTNVAGLSTSCDPVDFTLSLNGSTESHVFRRLSPAEHYVRIIDGAPGIKTMTLIVNGNKFPVNGLEDGETLVIDIESAMFPYASAVSMSRKANPTNTVEVYATGARGDSAYVLVGDASIIGGAAVTSIQPAQ